MQFGKFVLHLDHFADRITKRSTKRRIVPLRRVLLLGVVPRDKVPVQAAPAAGRGTTAVKATTRTQQTTGARRSGFPQLLDAITGPMYRGFSDCRTIWIVCRAARSTQGENGHVPATAHCGEDGLIRIRSVGLPDRGREIGSALIASPGSVATDPTARSLGSRGPLRRAERCEVNLTSGSSSSSRSVGWAGRRRE